MGWTLACAAILFAVGARAGAGRLAAVLVGMGAGAALAPWLGPELSRALVISTGWNTWAGVMACWSAAYLVAAAATALVVNRLFRRAASDAAAPRRFHRGGAALGAVAGALVGWIALGDFAETALETLPDERAAAATNFALRRPLEILRACRTLRSLTPEEADALASRREVQAVFAAKSFDRMLRLPGVMRRFSEAAEGDWTAIAALMADPQLKAAMDEPDFLHRLRAVDVVQLADEVERRRRGEGVVDEGATADVAALPAVATDADFQRRIAEELTTDAKPDAVVDRAAAETYWNRVGLAIEVLDRPQGPGAWIPRAVAPFMPEVKPLIVEQSRVRE